MNFEPVVMLKVNRVIVVLQILVGLEYAAFLGMSFLNPIGAQGFGLSEYGFSILALAILGMSGLSYALRKIEHREEVWLWLLIAVGTAPFVTFIFSGFVLNGLRFLGFTVGTRSYIAITALGFFLSFIYIGFRLRNKYRHNEVGGA